MKPAVLVTKKVFSEAIELLKSHADVEYEASESGIPASDLGRRVKGKNAIVSQLTDKFDASMIDKLEGVRVIANVAVGFDNIDVPAATRKGILVTNTPDVLTRHHCGFRVCAADGRGTARRGGS